MPMKKSACLIGMNVLYYAALAALVFMLILPHTSIAYRWDIFSSYSDRVNSKTIYLRKGERYKIDFFGVSDTVDYRSSDFKVACVERMGIVTALKTGKTYIEIKRPDSVSKYRVYVIGLNRKRLKMHISEFKKLSVKGYSGKVNWKSSNKKVVSVNRFGWLHSKKKGTAVITVKVKGIELACKVTVA